MAREEECFELVDEFGCRGCGAIIWVCERKVKDIALRGRIPRFFCGVVGCNFGFDVFFHLRIDDSTIS